MVTVVLDVVWAGHVTQSRHQGGEIGGWLGRPREERRVDILEDDLLQTPLLRYVGYEGVSEYFILQAFVVKLLKECTSTSLISLPSILTLPELAS